MPCHRVVGKDGQLTGYAGGLDRKRFLLDLEEPAERARPAVLTGDLTFRTAWASTGYETVRADRRQHGPMVLRVCRAVLGRADADDAWSETFLAALRAYPDLPADANVEAWLVTIAHRKAIDVTRATRAAAPVARSPTCPSTRPRPRTGTAT